jgi:hypothetical protein
MNVKAIIIEYLKAHGYDGLYSPDMECACHMENLCPCEDSIDQCEPGYSGPDPSGESDYRIYVSKKWRDKTIK